MIVGLWYVLWCFVFDTLFLIVCVCVLFFKHNAAYEMRISDWSSDVCSSDLLHVRFFDPYPDAPLPEASAFGLRPFSTSSESFGSSQSGSRLVITGKIGRA